MQPLLMPHIFQLIRIFSVSKVYLNSNMNKKAAIGASDASKWKTVATDVLIAILSFLPPKDVSHARRVTSTWMVNADRLWKTLLAHTWPAENPGNDPKAALVRMMVRESKWHNPSAHPHQLDLPLKFPYTCDSMSLALVSRRPMNTDSPCQPVLLFVCNSARRLGTLDISGGDTSRAPVWSKMPKVLERASRACVAATTTGAVFFSEVSRLKSICSIYRFQLPNLSEPTAVLTHSRAAKLAHMATNDEIVVGAGAATWDLTVWRLAADKVWLVADQLTSQA